MRKAQSLFLLGCTLSLAAICLDALTNLPDYLVFLLWPFTAICIWLGVREARRLPRATAPLTGACRRRRFIILLGAVLIGCIGGFFINAHSEINLPFTTQLVIAFVTFALCMALIYWRIYKRPANLP